MEAVALINRSAAVAVAAVSYTSLTLAGLLMTPVCLLLLYDLTLYVTRVVNLRLLSKMAMRTVFNLTTINSIAPPAAKKEEEENDSAILEKVTSVRNNRGRISFRRTVQRCEQVIYENSVVH